MNKTELIAAVAKATDLKKVDAEKAINAAVAAIQDSLKKGERVAVPGLGIFSIAERKARVGINPQTKAKIKIAASKVAKFKAGKDLKTLINKKRK